MQHRNPLMVHFPFSYYPTGALLKIWPNPRRKHAKNHSISWNPILLNPLRDQGTNKNSLNRHRDHWLAVRSTKTTQGPITMSPTGESPQKPLRHSGVASRNRETLWRKIHKETWGKKLSWSLLKSNLNALKGPRIPTGSTRNHQRCRTHGKTTGNPLRDPCPVQEPLGSPKDL